MRKLNWPVVLAAFVAGLVLAGAGSWGQTQTPWTAPMTWQANTRLTPASLNQQLRDNMLHLKYGIDNLDLSPTGLAANPTAQTLYRGNDSWYTMLDANGRLTFGVLASGTPEVGQIPIYGTGGPAWSYPFEVPRTRSGIAASSVIGSNQRAIFATSTVQFVFGTVITATVTGTARTTDGTARVCTVRFTIPARSSIGAVTLLNFGNTTVLSNSSGPSTFSVTASNTYSNLVSGLSGSAFPVMASIDPAGCDVDAGATLQLTTE